MRTKLSIATAIAGSMVVTGLLWGAAQATPAPLLNSDANSGIVLVGHGGGHGGGPGGGLGRGGGPGAGWVTVAAPAADGVTVEAPADSPCVAVPAT